MILESPVQVAQLDMDSFGDCAMIHAKQAADDCNRHFQVAWLVDPHDFESSLSPCRFRSLDHKDGIVFLTDESNQLLEYCTPDFAVNQHNAFHQTDWKRDFDDAITKFHLQKGKIKASAYFLVVVCLLLFSMLSVLYLNVPTDFQRDTPQYLSNSNFTAQAIACGFPASGQYGPASATIYTILLVATFFVRRVHWLSTAMAAWVMAYSGVAAIHLIVLFAFNKRQETDTHRNYCTQVTIGPSDETLSVCHGIHDPDYVVAGLVVSEGLLAILPIATWSSTFKTETGKPILVLWTGLLAIGHAFFNIITPNPYINYQICANRFPEELQGQNFQAVPENRIVRMHIFLLSSFGDISRATNQRNRNL